MMYSVQVALDTHVLWGINAFIQVTVISICALGGSRLFDNAAVSRWWLFGSALLLILISPLTALLTQVNEIGVASISRSTVSSHPTPAAPIEESVPNSFRPQVDTPVATDRANLTRGDTMPESSMTSLPAQRPASEKAIPAPVVAPQKSAINWGTMLRFAVNGLLLLWVVGILAKLCRLACGWRWLHVIRSEADVVGAGTTAEVFAQVCEQFKLWRRPVLLVSDRISGPVSAGVFHPAVLLPQSLTNQLSIDQLRDVLRHEVAHVARFDQVVVIAQNMLQCLYWIHPLVGKLNRQFSQAREELCDNVVLQSTSATDYSRTLLILAQHVSGERIQVAVGMLGGWNLESRVAGLLEDDRNTATRLSRRSVAKLAVVFVVLVALGLGVTISESAAVPPVSERKEDVGDNDKPLPPSAMVEFTGIVVGPNQKPVAGAKLYIARLNAKPVAISDAHGRFKFSRPKETLPLEVEFTPMNLIAVADGYGIAISRLMNFQSSYRVIKAVGFPFTVSSDDERQVLELAKDEVPIRGRIVDRRGKPVPNVDIQVRYVDKTYTRFAFNVPATNADGRFEIHGIGDGRVVRLAAWGEAIEFSQFAARTTRGETEVRLEKADSLDPFREIDPNGKGSLLNPFGDDRVGATKTAIYGAEFTHKVGPSVPVEGRVSDAVTGKPLADVLLSPWYPVTPAPNLVTPDPDEFSVVTDAEGRYRVVGFPLGRSSLTASTPARGYLEQEFTIEVTDGEPTINVDLNLAKGIVLFGRVTDKETEQPIKGIFVNYYACRSNDGATGGQFSIRHTETDQEGRYRFNVIPGEGYVMTSSFREGYTRGVLNEKAKAKLNENGLLPTINGAYHPGHWSVVQAINLSASQASKKCDFQLERSPKVTLRMVDVEGNPVNGVSARESIGSFSSAPLREDENGFQVKMWTRNGAVQVEATQEELGLIGQVFMSEEADPNLPMIPKDPAVAAKIKLNHSQIRGDSEVTLTMQPAAKLRCRLVDGNGKPISFAKISEFDFADEDGHIESELLIPNYPVSEQGYMYGWQKLLGSGALDKLILEPGEVRDFGDIQFKAEVPSVP